MKFILQVRGYGKTYYERERRKNMNLMDYDTTPLECDRRCWVYSNGNSITFSEIENEIKERTNNLFIRVYGHYVPKDLSIKPTVYVRAETENGYVCNIALQKNIFKEKHIEYYDYLVNKIAHKFAKTMFINVLESKGDENGKNNN